MSPTRLSILTLSFACTGLISLLWSTFIYEGDTGFITSSSSEGDTGFITSAINEGDTGF